MQYDKGEEDGEEEDCGRRRLWKKRWKSEKKRVRDQRENGVLNLLKNVMGGKKFI